MEPLLCRAKPLSKAKALAGKWIHGYYLEDAGTPAIRPKDKSYNALIDKKTLGYSSGLHDMHGKPLYSDDIVRIINSVNYLFGDISTIEFYQGSFHLTLIYDLTPDPLLGFTTVFAHNDRTGDPATASWLQDIELLGNIFDNPELLGIDEDL